jgi:hypothetical protein
MVVNQGNFTAGFERFGSLPTAGKRDGNGPEQAAGRLEIVAHAPPVGVGHEALKWGEAADAQHQQVTFFARTDLDFGKGPGALRGFAEGVALEQQRFQLSPSVRMD